MSQFYIMNAKPLTKRKITVEESTEWWGRDGTVLVAQREYGYQKFADLFIWGTCDDYGVKPGDSVTYTQDTGNGLKNRGRELYIQNVIQIRDGKISGWLELDDSGHVRENLLGTTEKRNMWVMK